MSRIASNAALAALALAALCHLGAQAQSEDTPEVVLEAYAEGYYRPTLVHESRFAPDLAPEKRPTAETYRDRLLFALEWSGYVHLEPAAAWEDTSDTLASRPPATHLLVELGPGQGQQARARVALAEVNASPFYAGTIAFTGEDAEASADASAEEVIRQLTGMTPPFRARICAVERQPNNVKELVLLDWDGSSRWQLTRDNSIALSPSWAQDGRRIAFASFRAGGDLELYVADLTRGRIRTLVARRGTDAAPAWSPVRDEIVFAGSSGRTTHLYLVNADGSDLRQLTTSRAIDTSPSWSPTGNQIVFMSDRLGNPQIFRMDRDGANLRKLTAEGDYNADPAWSPAGDRIVYLRRTSRGFQIRSTDPTGEVDVPLTSEPGDHLDPSWSPDGMKITYSYRGKVWVMNADGTDKRPLLARGLMPAWSPLPD